MVSNLKVTPKRNINVFPTHFVKQRGRRVFFEPEKPRMQSIKGTYAIY